MSAGRRYSDEPPKARAFTERCDRYITRIARAYDLAVPLMPFWRRWLSAALPHLRGPRVLEVSFGTGWLLTQYAGRHETYGVDLNQKMLRIANRNLQRRGLVAELQLANSRRCPTRTRPSTRAEHDGVHRLPGRQQGDGRAVPRAESGRSIGDDRPQLPT